jgi:ribosome-binding factor A
MSRRVEQIGDIIRAELSRLILAEVRDPRVKLASVSNVEMSRDLRHARVRVSVLGTEEERTTCVEALQKARGFLRTRIAAKVQLRHAPELTFQLDRGAEHADHIQHLLDQDDERNQPS